ncbi:hypothetical protein BDV96DRAFT_493923 [Lophiotrema nucula]|uniref:F-box domain-containing protein n=1 Tax=Lophiotrema nucula TaxID=690887 RepID=A0A6A5Z6T2_9PLEO|nr:hypothetical protein BDV96DRAFT_493923 [Lophiotrema nucula]
MVQDYFMMLGLIIQRCRNLAHLTVVSLETSDVSFWKALLLDKVAPPRFTTHGFARLRTLALQLHTEDYGLGEESTLFPRIYNALASVPSLQQLRASGVVSDGSCTTTSDQVRSLDTIDITECILDLQDVLNIASGSTALKHFSCSWAYLNSQGFNIPDLFPILLSHKDTLESLVFDAREVRFNANDYPRQSIGSLKEFTALQSLSICETSFLNTQISILDFPDQHISLRISELLPNSLKWFTLFLRPDYGYDDDNRIDEVFALWALAEDCPKDLPNLRTVCLQAENNLSAPLLTREFQDKRVELILLQDAYAHQNSITE